MDPNWLSQNQSYKLIKNTLVKNLAIFGSGNGIAQIFMVIYALLLARFLSPSGYGLFAGSYAIANLTAFLFNWGLDTWLLRETVIKGNGSQTTGTVLIIKMGFGVVWGLLLVSLLPIVQPQVYIRSFMAICVLDVLGEGLFTAQISLLNAKKNFHQASVLLLISRGGRLLGAVALIFTGFRDPLMFTLGRYIATFIALICAFILSKPQFTYHKLDHYRQIYKKSLAFGLSDLLSAIYIQADISLLAIINGSRSAIGAYSPATGLISALFIIPNAFYLVILPNIIKVIENQENRLGIILRRMFLGFSGLGLLLFSSIWIIGRPLTILILGPAYKTTGDLMAILSPILFMKSIEFGCAAVIVATGLQKYRLGPQLLSALTNVILNIIFIPIWGVWAVAYVYDLSELVLFIGYIWLVVRWWQNIKMEPDIKWVSH